MDLEELLLNEAMNNMNNMNISETDLEYTPFSEDFGGYCDYLCIQNGINVGSMKWYIDKKLLEIRILNNPLNIDLIFVLNLLSGCLHKLGEEILDRDHTIMRIYNRELYDDMLNMLLEMNNLLYYKYKCVDFKIECIDKIYGGEFYLTRKRLLL